MTDEPKTYGNWTVIRRGPKDFVCKCICGKEQVRTSASTIKNGTSKSCGCLRKKLLKENNPMHRPDIAAKVSKKVKAAQTEENIKKRVEASQSDEARSKRIKTNNERYGGNSPAMCPETTKKMQDTKLKNHGNKSYVNPDKARDTCNERYGVSNVMKRPEMAELVSKKVTEACISSGKTMFLPNGEKLVDYAKSKGREPSRARVLYHHYGPQFAEDWIDNYDGTASSLEQFGIDVFVKAGLDAEVCNKMPKELKELGFRYKPDILVRSGDKQLYVDLDGLYYHSEAKKLDKNYHLQKRQDYESAGLTLFQIREDEIKYKTDIVLSIVKAKLGLASNRFVARELDVVKVPQAEADEFLLNNHLMGKISAKHLGLRTKSGELICMFSYKKKGDGIDISRFVSKMDTYVVGGLSRLMSHAVKESNPNCIISFVDMRYANGSSLIKLNFAMSGITLGWKWTDKKATYNRTFCQATSDLTELEHAKEKGLYRIYDAGQAKFIKNLKETTDDQ